MAVEQQPFNPKIHRIRMDEANRATLINLNIVKKINPITLQIKDAAEVLKTYNKWPLIPYAGNIHYSMDGLLLFLNSARSLSATLGACHESIKTYAFGTKIGMKWVEDEDFDMDEEEEREGPPIELKREYKDFAKTIHRDDLSYTQMAENLYDDLKGNGNYYIEVVHTETAGIRSTAIHIHPAENCRYWATKKGEDRILAISPCWDYEYLRTNKPSLVNVFPKYTVDKTLNTQRTIIHCKNGNWKWYGRPDWIAAWLNVFKEYQSTDYLSKITGAMFTGEVFIEVEAEEIEENDFDERDAQDAGHGSVSGRMDANFTNKSDDPQTIMYTTRPPGARSAFVHEFQTNTKETFFKVTGDIDRQKIIENNQWSERLLGNATSDGFATEAFADELRAKEVSVLGAYRQKIEYGLNLAVQQAILWAGVTGLDEIGMYFKSTSQQFKTQEGSKTIKEVVDAFGVAVRAGVITPTLDDEEHFRQQLGLATPAVVKEAWDEDGGFRRPITLKGAADSETEEIRAGGAPNPDDEDDDAPSKE